MTRCVACLLGRRFEVRQRITEFESGRRLGLQHFTGFEGEVHWSFSPEHDDASTRISFDACYGAPPVLLEVFGGDQELIDRVVTVDVQHGLDNLQLVLNWLALKDQR